MEGVEEPLSKKLKLALDTERYSDVVPLVSENEEEVKCHKMMLSLGSPVLWVMVENRWDQQKDEGPELKIKLPEASVPAIKFLLNVSRPPCRL